VIRGLRAGESPKEIAARLHVGWECVKNIIKRHQDVRHVFVETHPLRHPNIDHPPLKIIQPLGELNRKTSIL
jgi:hypothetical protein